MGRRGVESIVITHPTGNHGAAARSLSISLAGTRLPLMRYIACGRGT